jgi:predicted nucleic acid-binding protein
MILVDTNIPLRLAQIGHRHRQPALDALQLLTLRDQEHFAIAPQSLYEMYVVLTRPASGNGFGCTPQRAAAETVAARAIFEILPETAQVYPAWEGLIAERGC